MQIASVRIQNLRAFADETVAFDDYTCLVGPNGSGKSTVLCALNIFFRETSHTPAGQNLTALSEEDFHRRDTKTPIRVTVTFTNLSEDAKQDFADYVRQDLLVITAEATFDAHAGTAQVTQHGERLGMKEFSAFFAQEGEGVAASKLAETYASIRKDFADLPEPAGKKGLSKQQMIDALREFETKHPERRVLLRSHDQFYGFTKGVNRLDKYVQWVFVPAVKDAATEQIESKNTALGKLLARAVGARANLKDPIDALRTATEQQYKELLARHDDALKEISASLRKRLTSWTHPDTTLRLGWRHDEKSVRVEEPLACCRR